MASPDWKALLELAAPVVGTLTSRGHGADASFMQGFQESQARIAQDREAQTREADLRRKAGADYLLRVGQQAMQFEDPVLFEQFVALAEDAGTQAGYLQPGELRQRVAFPQSKAAATRLKELTTELDRLSKSHDLQQLAEGGATIEFADGSRLPVEAAIAMTRRWPKGREGQSIAPPRPQPAGTEYDRFLARWARDRGKAVADLTSAEEVTAREAYTAAGRAPTKDTPATGAEGVFADLIALWQEKNPGKDVPPAVRSRLRLQAQREFSAAGRAPEKAETPTAPSPYALERAQRVLQSVDELSKKVSRWTTGVGSILARVPESAARDFAAELETLKANIAFNELTAMREASKTGGALGQVSDREASLLAAALGALDPGQSPANIKAQLAKIKGNIERWAQAMGASQLSSASIPAVNLRDKRPLATGQTIGRFQVTVEP